MKPLYKIIEVDGIFGIYGDPEDYELYKADLVLYDELSDRADILIEEAFKKYMGSFYGKKPLPYYKELKDDFDNRIKKKKRLIKFGLPKVIIENEERMLYELYNQMLNKEFALKHDEEQKKYREEYNKRERDFYESTEYKILMKEICHYNLSKWNERKAQLGK